MGVRAVVITQEPGGPSATVGDVDPELLVGDLLIEVESAGINFKDSMALEPGNRVARISPLIGGVDLAGTVLEAPPGGPEPGSRVIAHGHGVGTSSHGGFAQLARVSSSWAVALPGSLSPQQAMALGTAGFTAMASLLALEGDGLDPSAGELLVTGAAGGVGSTAVALAAAAGFEVVASSGRSAEHGWLEQLGARRIIGRSDIDPTPERGLSEERWAGAIDCVGGATLVGVLRTLAYGGAVAASGLTGGSRFEASVFPFIVRAVRLIGIDAVEMPAAGRSATWQALADRFPLEALDQIIEREIGLDGVPDALREIAGGRVRGRILVDPRR